MTATEALEAVLSDIGIVCVSDAKEIIDELERRGYMVIEAMAKDEAR